VEITSVNVSLGVSEQRFSLEVAGERIPGILWIPAEAQGPRPLILMGHGGSQHKRIDTLLARARSYVRHFGFAIAAIDAPGHGERASAEERARRIAGIQDRIAQRRLADPAMVQDIVNRAAKAVPEWQATLDTLQTLDAIGPGGPVGYWGVSMGTMNGVPFVASEPRIRCAVFGLAGVLPGNDSLTEAARKISIPVEFALQADDEIVARDAGIALFDAFASTEKTMHLNPGGHLGIPAFEAASWGAFFVRHLR
jgi:pimeloyl-ACP methyl ester carboxylesterase